jgi:hypothetical protein
MKYIVPGEFMPKLQDIIPEVISSQKFHVNMGRVLNGYKNKQFPDRWIGRGD